MIRINQFVSYRSSGKVACLEGSEGMRCVGTVKEMFEDGGNPKAKVQPWHRTHVRSQFPDLYAVVDLDELKPLYTGAEARRINHIVEKKLYMNNTPLETPFHIPKESI